MWYGRHHQQFQGHGGGIFFLFPLLLFAVLIGLLIYLLVRASRHGGLGGRFAHTGGGPGGPGGPVGPGARFGPDPAFDQARFRYARGEISRDEYYRLVEDLGWGPGAPPTGTFYGASAAAPPPPGPAPTEPFTTPGPTDAGPAGPPPPPPPPAAHPPSRHPPSRHPPSRQPVPPGTAGWGRIVHRVGYSRQQACGVAAPAAPPPAGVAMGGDHRGHAGQRAAAAPSPVGPHPTRRQARATRRGLPAGAVPGRRGRRRHAPGRGSPRAGRGTRRARPRPRRPAPRRRRGSGPGGRHGGVPVGRLRGWPGSAPCRLGAPRRLGPDGGFARGGRAHGYATGRTWRG